MDVLTKNELKALVDHEGGACVSIYLPIQRAGSAAQQKQNPIRLRNLLREAEDRLLALGRKGPETKQLLQPIHQLVEEMESWQIRPDALALFRSSELFHRYQLPRSVPELVVVAPRFHVKPLLPLLSSQEHFYILALSQNAVRLLKGTEHSVTPIALDGIPQSLAEALKYDDLGPLDHFYSGSQGRPSGGISPLSGHGVGGGDDKRQPHDELLRYFRQIDTGLHPLLRNERAPLVLAGVEYLFPIYRQMNTYAHLIEEGIRGNPEAASAEELRAQAWNLLQPHFLRAQTEAAGRYRQLAGGEHASSKLEEIVAAAHHGRIDTLFVADGVQNWGTYDPRNSEVHLHQEPAPGDVDLLDLAAVQSLLHGGRVFVVAPAEIPDEFTHSPVAAIFRY